jgi:hypothetical protein
MKNMKKIGIIAICFVLLGTGIMLYKHSSNEEPVVSIEGNNLQEPVEGDNLAEIEPEGDLLDADEELPDMEDKSLDEEASLSGTNENDESREDEKNHSSHAVQELVTDYHLPGIKDLLKVIAKSDIAQDGTVTLTADIKCLFNQMGRDYQFTYLPEVDWYNFESVGAGLYYILRTAGEDSLKGMPQNEVEARLRKVFAAPNNEYPPIKHQTYSDFVMLDGEIYSFWPVGLMGYTSIYELTNLSMRKEGDYTYYTAFVNEYLFDLDGNYPSGKNETFLFDKAEVLGYSPRATLEYLLITEEIREADKKEIYKIEFRVEGDSIIPVIISVRCGEYGNPNSIVYDNTEYGFTFFLPESWPGYTVITGQWEKSVPKGSADEKMMKKGPQIFIRHPRWTSEDPRQDIPIMIFSHSQWDLLQQTLPTWSRVLAHNAQYVFVTSYSRYQDSYLPGCDEVESILNGKPLQVKEKQT